MCRKLVGGTVVTDLAIIEQLVSRNRLTITDLEHLVNSFYDKENDDVREYITADEESAFSSFLETCIARGFPQVRVRLLIERLRRFVLDGHYRIENLANLRKRFHEGAVAYVH